MDEPVCLARPGHTLLHPRYKVGFLGKIPRCSHLCCQTRGTMPCNGEQVAKGDFDDATFWKRIQTVEVKKHACTRAVPVYANEVRVEARKKRQSS